MTEIASSSQLLSGADLVPPGQRDARPRQAPASAVPFGALVSNAAQNQQRPARPQEEPPAPRTPSFEEETRATQRREAREAQEQAPREKLARRDDDAARPQAKAHRRAEDRKDDEAGPARADEPASDTTGADNVSEAQGEKQDAKAGEVGESHAEETVADEAVNAEAEATDATVTAEATVEPTLVPETAKTELHPAALLAAQGAAVAAEAGTEGEGEAGPGTPGLVRAGVVVAETPAAAVLTALASGDKPKEQQAATAVDAGAVPTAEIDAPAGAKGSADLIALLQAKAETPVKAAAPAPHQPPAGEIAKANFADWINEFALAQGATHRSGDLVGSLDRALAAVPTAHAGQDALRPTPLQMLPIEIGMQAVRGVKTFQIRLDPAELGRVEVKLEFKEDGEVKASLVVDRVETLAMLKRDAPTLQQAFEQAGLRQSPDGLSFQLRGEQQGRDGQREKEGQGQRAWADDSEEAGAARPAEFVMRRVMIPHSSLDLVI